MANVLVVANDTHGGPPLIEAIRERASRGDVSFVVIAPMTRPQAGYVIYDESVRHHANSQIGSTLGPLRELGISARGEAMDPDPYTATLDAVREFAIDEIIISTHPEQRSGWLRRNLLERVRQSTGLPTTHVVVDLDAVHGAGTTHTLVVANRTAGGEPLFEALRARARPPRTGSPSSCRRTAASAATPTRRTRGSMASCAGFPARGSRRAAGSATPIPTRRS